MRYVSRIAFASCSAVDVSMFGAIAPFVYNLPKHPKVQGYIAQTDLKGWWGRMETEMPARAAIVGEDSPFEKR